MSWPGIVLCAYVAAVSVPLVVVDIREHRLPNRLVVPGLALALLCGVLEVVLAGGHGWMPLLSGLVAFAVFALGAGLAAGGGRMLSGWAAASAAAEDSPRPSPKPQPKPSLPRTFISQAPSPNAPDHNRVRHGLVIARSALPLQALR